MSLSLRNFRWRDDFVVALTPQRIATLSRKRGFSLGQIVSDLTICPDGVVEEKSNSIPTLIREFSSFIETNNQVRGNMHLVLSNIFFHYLVLPPEESIRTRSKLLNYARSYLDDRCDSSSLHISISGGTHREPHVVSAIEKSFIGNLIDKCATHHIDVRSIQPYLMCSFNIARKQIDSSSFTLAVREERNLCLLTAIDNKWHSIRSITAPSADSVLAQIRRERNLLIADGHEPPIVVLVGPVHGLPDSIEGSAIQRIGLGNINGATTSDALWMATCVAQ